MKRARTAGHRAPPTLGGGAAEQRQAANAAHVLAVAATHDRDAFAALFAHFAPRVKTYLIRLGASASAAEDLAQETMLTVWRKASFFDPRKAECATWVFTIARNLRIDALRRERRPDLDAADPIWAPRPPPAPDERLVAARRDQKLRLALGDLPDEQAIVVRLSFYQDKPHREIERDLGIPLGTVKSRLRLAMIRLRTLLGEPS